MGPQTINIIQLIGNAGLMVKFVLLLLLFFSITSWAIIFIKYKNVRKAYRESVFFTDFFWKSRNLSDAFAKAKHLRSSPTARIFRMGYMELKKLNPAGVRKASQPSDNNTPSSPGMQLTGIDNVKRALRRACNTELTRLMRLVPFLATAGNIAPFIGLFGTVWGIMNSFHGIGQKKSVSLAVVAPGISEALIATAAGLAVAIPAVIAFNYFMNRIRVFESELQSFSADFLNIIERNILQTKGGNE